MVDGESHPGTLVSTIHLSQQSMQILQGREPATETTSRFASLRLYELRDADILMSTRQLAFLRTDQPSLSDAVTFWLPLADTSVQQNDEHVLLSWPDCDHHVEDFANGKTLHSRVYKRNAPNNALLIHCVSSEEAHDFACKLHAPCEEQLTFQNDPIKLSSDPVDSQWTLTDSGEATEDTAQTEASHSVQFFGYPTLKQPAKSRGLLVRGCNDSTSSTSRLYWMPAAIDVTLGLHGTGGSGQPKPCVILDGLLFANYMSGVRNVHHSRKHDEGTCQAVEPAVCRVTWCFDFNDGKQYLCFRG